MILFNFIKGFIDRLFILVGAFCGCQIPEFIQQYQQRLSGHEAELNQLVNKLSQMASFSGKTLAQYVDKFKASADPDFTSQGVFMSDVISRWQDLHITLQSLSDSTVWERPYYFFKYLNYPIANATLENFQPGINLSVEGLGYTAIGMAIAYLIYQLLLRFIQVGYSGATKLIRSHH